MVPHGLPRRLPFRGPFARVAPSHLWDKRRGGGRVPTRDLPRTAHAPGPHSGEGLCWLAGASAGGMGGWDWGKLAGWTLTLCVEVRGGFLPSVCGFGTGGGP